jgi:CubicO group peptidase (beta-lactamase class C family)
VIETGIEEGVTPSVVAGYWRTSDPHSIHVAHLGKRRLLPSEQPVLPETVFDLASVTKVFGTATLAATLVDRGWLRWDSRVASFFSGYPHPEIQVSHLLSHTAGFVAWQPFWEQMREAFSPMPIYSISIKKRQEFMRKIILSIHPEFKVEEKTIYSDISFLLLGFILEEIVRMPLDQAIQRFVWKPMGIQGAFFRRVKSSAEDAVLGEVAATELCPWRGGVLQGQVHDDNCWVMGGYGGHAGAFGSIRDVLHFAKRLFEGFLSPEVLRAVWTRVLKPVGCERTLGWDTPSGDLPAASRLFSPQSVGHLGFSGTSLWIDPVEKLAVVLLTNRIHPSRENIKIRSFRPNFHEAIRLDLQMNSP